MSTTKTTTKTADILALVTVKRDAGSLSSASVSLTYSATFVTLDPETGAPRNISSGAYVPTKDPRELGRMRRDELAALTVHGYHGCVFSDSILQDWGLGVSYRELYDVDGPTAARMASTLARVERSLDAQTVELGECESFGEYVLRVARALGVSRFMVRVGEQRGSLYSDSTWRELDGRGVRADIRSSVATLMASESEPSR